MSIYDNVKVRRRMDKVLISAAVGSIIVTVAWNVPSYL